jgi:hypothetical protein
MIAFLRQISEMSQRKTAQVLRRIDAFLSSFLRPKAEPKTTPKLHHILHRQLHSVMAGAAAAMRELPELANQAKLRLRDDRPIVRDDLLELLRNLIAAQKRIEAEMQSDSDKSGVGDTGDTVWDNRRYQLFVVPVRAMANSPQAIADLTLAASNNGAKNIRLLYELLIAEMDVAVARFNVTVDLGVRPPHGAGENGSQQIRE